MAPTARGSAGHAADLETLVARDRWSREDLEGFQRRRLREVIEHAVSASPYYRDVLGADALAPDVPIDDLPTLTKATLMEQFDRIVTRPSLRLAAAEAHAAGADPAALLSGEYHVFTTSGTTGRRGVFPQTVAEFRQWVAAGQRAIRRACMDPSWRPIGIAAPTPLHITQKLFGALGGFARGRPALTATMPVPELVRALNADRPAMLFTIPSVAAVLAGEQLDGRLAIDLRGIVLAGEVLPAGVIAQVEAAWGIAPIQIYAATEALMMASESADRVGLHINEDLIVLEVVDERHRPVPPGRPGYTVLITSLIGRLIPLIRYELADSVTLASGRDPSGRPFRRIERVDGRNDDQLRLPARSGGQAMILPHHLRAPFAMLPDVLQYQIVHAQQRLVLRLVLHPNAGAETPERAVAGVRAALEAAGAITPAIEVETVSKIECEPGGAKVKLVKSM